MSFPDEWSKGRAGLDGTHPIARSPWSWRFGSLGGVPIRIHITLIVLIGWIALSMVVGAVSPHATLAGIGLVALVLGSIGVHEVAHAVIARRYGVSTREVTLLPIGGVARVELAPANVDDALAIALSGPIANLTIATVAAAVLGLTRLGANIAAPVDGVLPAIVLVNAAIAFGSLLPALPLDGGRALRAALERTRGREAATRILVRISVGLAIGLCVLAVFTTIWLVPLAVFLMLGARHETDVVTLDRAIATVAVDAAMNRHVTVVRPEDHLDTLVDRFRADPDAVAVVIDHGMLVGVVTPETLATLAAAA